MCIRDRACITLIFAAQQTFRITGLLCQLCCGDSFRILLRLGPVSYTHLFHRSAGRWTLQPEGPVPYQPSAFRIRCTFLDRFFFFSIRAATTGGGIFGIFLLFFRGFFPCASRSSLISFFNCSSKNSASSSAIRFRIFLLFARAFTWVARCV